MLDANLKSQLKGYLDKVALPIIIETNFSDCEQSTQMRTLVEQIAELCAHVEIREQVASAGRTPSFAINRPQGDTGISFAGVPLGHEFTSLVLALLHVGGHPPRIDEELAEQVRQLRGPLHFETFVSMSCQTCPEVVQALNLMAVLNPEISHVMIDGATHQDEIEARQIMAVPAVYLNGEHFHQGRTGVAEIVARLDSGAEAKAAEAISAKEPFDTLVIGGGPAGAAAAIYAARKGIRTGVVAERFGGQVLDTLSIENFISVRHTEGPQLARAMEEHVRDYDVDIMNLQRAEELSRDGDMFNVRLASGANVLARSIVLATGARWRQMGVPGEDEYRNRGVAYCPHCDGPLFKGKRVAVIGGGNSGVEAAIDLAGLVAHVTLIEFDHELRADAVLQRKLASLDNATVIKSALTTEVIGDGQRVTALTYTDRNTDSQHRIELDGIFVQIGLLPNSEWLQGTLELSKHGEIVIDARGGTSIPGVFAAGDVTTEPYKQIVVAMGAGTKAALSAFDHLIRTPIQQPGKVALSA